MIRYIKDLRRDKMFKIGCHLSSSKGYEAMINEAIVIGANTFQFFTKVFKDF